MSELERSEELIHKYLDETASEEEVRELDQWIRASPDVARQFMRLSRLDGYLSEIHIEDRETRIHTKIQQGARLPLAKPRRLVSRPTLLALASAIILSLTLAALFVKMPRKEGPVIAKLLVVKHVDGNAISESTDLRLGDEVALAADSNAVVRYPDETRIQIRGGTSVKFEKTLVGGKGVLVQDGTIEARVSRQPAAAPFKVISQHAEMTVVGTKFLVFVSEMATSLEVDEGAVELQRTVDGQKQLVKAGEYIQATSDQSTLLEPRRKRHAQRSQSPAPIRAPATVVDTGLPANGSFEVDLDGDNVPDGWQEAGTFKLDSDLAHSGHSSATAHGPSNADYTYALNLTFKRGARYRVSAWIRTANVQFGEGARMRFTMERSVDQPHVTRWVRSENEWTQVFIEFVVPENLHPYRLDLQWSLKSANERVWFDDVVLEEITE
jgi:ferric-dicitrate binding protein FerR (iron transport regulator)